MSKYGVISGPHVPVFSLNTGKYGPEGTPYLDTFHAVLLKIDCFSALLTISSFHINPPLYQTDSSSASFLKDFYSQITFIFHVVKLLV